MGVREKLAARVAPHLAPGEAVQAAFYAATPMQQRLLMIVIVPIVGVAQFAVLPTVIVSVGLATLAFVAAGDRLSRVIVGSGSV